MVVYASVLLASLPLGLQVLSAGRFFLQVFSGLTLASVVVEQILDKHSIFLPTYSQSGIHCQVHQGFVRKD